MIRSGSGCTRKVKLRAVVTRPNERPRDENLDKEIRALDHPMYPVASLRNFDDMEAGLTILENKIAQAGPGGVR